MSFIRRYPPTNKQEVPRLAAGWNASFKPHAQIWTAFVGVKLEAVTQTNTVREDLPACLRGGSGVGRYARMLKKGCSVDRCGRGSLNPGHTAEVLPVSCILRRTPGQFITIIIFLRHSDSQHCWRRGDALVKLESWMETMERQSVNKP